MYVYNYYYRSILILAGEDFNIIQQEIHILSECKHKNIVGYSGSYLRFVYNTQLVIIHLLYIIYNI